MQNINLLLRPYQEPDEEQVINLWYRCNLVVPWNDPKQDIKLKVQVQPELFFVGLIEDEVIATLMAGYEGHRGWFNYLAVTPEYQRQGIGKYMVEQATIKLKLLNCPKINIQIRNSNKDVIQFYEHLGFKIDDVISMGKRL
ncbi:MULTISPECIES: GNAT family acetyltransferase [unclassified Tolypothrix]|uniref:GNAT family acetyltransferase n=1 Tax=unclassified Tolypothrix TaxID=2649714 RepID=UPI0005EAA5D4|nr:MULTISPECIES: GNAT family acetyltransferase [unclassified Tolypothrix]BAY89876.1 GCN5-related N-acetyltransferase [Microchaete diplosiphon NIES-3275]EKF00869.1 toxin-antitoxin system, toxin component, GNAT family [Tolypothrix sp. PCC 7601]MBE9087107.1 GNAT family acetyltransferase [Tolypothrix sp. LEGE 11397]UYD24118.1 GNAT family acetyltransferase [Tolypothrix sp. PCC 7712]UYD33652.1 GNAT family acetyltransferase [Tolypothrix sp. PCC 7601]